MVTSRPNGEWRRQQKETNQNGKYPKVLNLKINT
jgi:hypothetical protein